MNFIEILSLEYFKEIGIAISLVIFCGGLIGVERGNKRRPAGLRTHILVCMGAMTVSFMSMEMHDYYLAYYDQVLDPNRLGAQVISGIGFLGAGTIIKYGTNIKGLTTAATIWAVAIIGLAIGFGYYALSIIVSVSLWGVLLLFARIENFIARKRKVFEVHVKLIDKRKVLGAINFLLAKYEIKILDLHIEKLDAEAVDIVGVLKGEDYEPGILELAIVISGKDCSHIDDIIDNITKLEGVLSAEKV